LNPANWIELVYIFGFKPKWHQHSMFRFCNGK
jgi:hypothetical protein